MMDPERYEDERYDFINHLDLDEEESQNENDWPDIVDLYADAIGGTFPGGPS